MLLSRPGVERVIYLDPDIRTYGSLEPIMEKLEGGTMVLTPHLLDPIDEGKKPAEVDILRSGSYNLGFIALARKPEAVRFLAGGRSISTTIAAWTWREGSSRIRAGWICIPIRRNASLRHAP
jgi:hypothetical protein